MQDSTKHDYHIESYEKAEDDEENEILDIKDIYSQKNSLQDHHDLYFNGKNKIQNDNFMQDFKSPPQLSSNSNTSFRKHKNRKNFARFNIVESSEDKQFDEGSHLNEYIPFSPPHTHVFKSQEELLEEQTVAQSSSQRQRNVNGQDTFRKQKLKDDNTRVDTFMVTDYKEESDKLVNKTSSNKENNSSFNPTLIQEGKLLDYSEQNMHQNGETIQDETNEYTEAGCDKTQANTASKQIENIQEDNKENLLNEKKEEETPNNPDKVDKVVVEQAVVSNLKNPPQLKLSLDYLTQKNSQSIDSKELAEDGGNSQTNLVQFSQFKEYGRKLTNAQSMNLSQTKAKKFFGRKSEFGLNRSQYDNPLISPASKMLDSFARESRDRQIQMQILERFSTKNVKYGKPQRQDSITSNNMNPMESKQFEQTWGIVNKICMLLKIKHRLKNLIKQRYSSLSDYESRMVGDLSDGKLLVHKSLTEQNRLLQSFLAFSFHPGSFPIIVFKICLLILTLMNLFYIPLVLGYDLGLASPSYTFFVFSTVMYAVEIMIKLKTSLSDKGEIITDTRIIAKKYLSNELFSDVISMIGIVLGQAQRVFFLLILLRIKNTFKYMEELNNHYYLAEKYHQVYVLTNLFGFIVMIVHYFACIFHFVGYYSYLYDPGGVSWISFYHLEHANWALKYNFALYFSFITCTTIGYGDITPQNTYERSVVIIFSIVATMCFSYSVNTIGNIFQDYFNKYQKQLQLILFSLIT